ncbi:MAG: serine/threonine-protein kinase [Planctomycetota bacterium]|nr:serine/threonine-protein kinase [Planctomycetota bacterium]
MSQISVPGYVIVKKIAEGGSSEIYKARRQPYNKEVALKVLRSKFIDNKKMIKAFDQEADILERCDHKNIIKINRLVKGGKSPAIDLELCETTHLKRYISKAVGKGNLLPLSESCAIFLQVVDALDYLHNTLNIVHKDLKPENVLVNEEGRVKLIDFSIAVEIKKSFLSKLFSKEPKPEGTPTYLSPEQIAGKFVDQRADIYSFSVMAFEIFAGRPPLTGRTMSELLMAHVKQRAPSLLSVRKDVPKDLAKIIDRSLSKRPEDRPDNINIIGEILKNYC